MRAITISRQLVIGAWRLVARGRFSFALHPPFSENGLFLMAEEDNMAESLASNLRITHLERRVRLLTFLLLGTFAAIAFASVIVMRTISASANESPKVIRTRGIVIEDGQGRPRLLLGAPIPKIEGRKRHDDLTNGIVLLEESGTDRLIVGDALAPQTVGAVGQRKGTEHASGFWINDSDGNERGGYITTGDDALLTLDYRKSDAFHLSAGVDSASMTLRAPGDRLRAMLFTDGDHPAKLLFFAQGGVDMLRVDGQTTKRLPPAHSDQELFEILKNTNP
jgi:hypothetical protein